MGRLASLLASVALLLCAAAFPSVPAHAEKRVALVIGNDTYINLPELQKAANDARAVGAVLKELGFEVISGANLTRREINRKLADFEATLKPGDQAFLFFAGHGVAIGAENYLLPTDMPKPRAGEEGLVQDEAHAVNALIERVRARGAGSSFFVLDACRDNPFAATGVRSIGGTRGLTRVTAPTGVFVLFSAGIGQTALDRLGDADPDPNSVFTRKLVPLLKTPGLSHVRIAKQVQREVSELAAKVPHDQQPAYYDQIIGDVVLLPGNAPPETARADDGKLAALQQELDVLKKQIEAKPEPKKDEPKVAVGEPPREPMVYVTRVSTQILDDDIEAAYRSLKSQYSFLLASKDIRIKRAAISGSGTSILFVFAKTFNSRDANKWCEKLSIIYKFDPYPDGPDGKGNGSDCVTFQMSVSKFEEIKGIN